MMRGILIAALVAAVAPSAGAYDVMYSGDVAVTHEAGAFGIRASYLHFSADQWFMDGKLEDGVVIDQLIRSDADAKYSGTFIPVDLRYSPFRLLEVGATPVFLMEKIENYEDPVSGLKDHESVGVGDTWLWAKYNFSPEPLMSIRVGYKLTTGEDMPDPDELPTGSGQSDIDGAVMFGVPAGPGWLDAAVGYRYRTKRKADLDIASSYDFKPGNEVHFFAGYTQLVGEAFNVRLGADGTFGSDYEGGPNAGGDQSAANADTGASIISFNPGVDYLFGNGAWVGFDLHYPVAGKNVNASWGFGFTVGWGM
jgi:hypothetical protein